MTNPITPEAVELAAARLIEPRTSQDCVHGAMLLRALARELAEVKAELDGYREWGYDVKRLTRELDVEMHGEENAAQQASLCDLIGAGRDLRARAEAAEVAHAYELKLRVALQADLATARAQIVAAWEAGRNAGDTHPKDCRHCGGSGEVNTGMQSIIGQDLFAECGCGQPPVNPYRALPLTDPADALAEHDRAVRADERAKCAEVAGRHPMRFAGQTEDTVREAISAAILARGEQEGRK